MHSDLSLELSHQDEFNVGSQRVFSLIIRTRESVKPKNAPRRCAIMECVAW